MFLSFCPVCAHENGPYSDSLSNMYWLFWAMYDLTSWPSGKPLIYANILFPLISLRTKWQIFTKFDIDKL